MEETRCQRYRTSLLILLLFAFSRISYSTPLHSFFRSRNDLGREAQLQPTQSARRVQLQRQQKQDGEFESEVYYRMNDIKILGKPNYMAAIGNPLKGLVGFGPLEFLNQTLPDSVPSAIEKYNLGLNEIMIGKNQFNWTTFDLLLEASASRNMHAVFSVFIHWPGQPLRLPPHLMDLPLSDTRESGKSPDYGNPRLLQALEQFIVAWGRHCDGDKRLAAIHVGLLGFWGEGHTYPDSTLVPESSKLAVAGWYQNSFTRTQVQARYPGPNADGFGLFDASLAYSTLDGEANGGVETDWFMYRQIIEAKQQDNWKQFAIGGETRPELQEIIFQDWYPRRTERKQDLRECIDALHISYVVHQDAFENNGYTGDVLNEANEIHAYMGYSFYVSEVVASTALPILDAEVVDVAVKISQLGIAPFYYDLSLEFECGPGIVKQSIPGVNEIVDQNTSATLSFRNIPATVECLDQIKVSLQSSYAYPNRSIKFGQGTDGAVQFRIPLPSTMDNHESWLSLLFSTIRNFFRMLFDIFL